MIENIKEISVILTLYKTPEDKLKNLLNYKNLKLLVFDQEGNNSTKKFLKKKFTNNLQYFSSKKNIGLSKASNFLLSKVNTTYFLFTQPDINIKKSSIQKLIQIMKKEKNLIILSPNHKKNVMNKKQKKINYVKKINFSCILINTKKIKKLGFFDEDFFLYWEDIYLEHKINNSKFKMAIANNIEVEHQASQSSKKNYITEYIRKKNYMYGEFLFDLKLNKLRFLKVLRKIFQNLILFCFNLSIFRFNNSLDNFSKLTGIIKFLIYFISRKKK